MKIYKKRGNKNYKERRLIKELEPILKKNLEQDSNFNVIPATNYQELQKLHSRYVVEDIPFEETQGEQIDVKPTEENTEKDMAKDKLENVEDVEFEETEKNVEDSASSNNQFIDPFNREEPIVRDYVMGNDSLSKGGNSNKDVAPKTSFDEPTSFEEAFEIPDSSEEETESSDKVKKTESKKEQTEPLNPSFDDMSTGKKKRSTKKFAKYIVEAVSVLSEKGFVWYANQDINEAKLTEYEMSGEMDLSLLVSLEDGQEVTVKQFFQVQCDKAEQMSKWTEEHKEDLSAALSEVLMEKGVAPSPTQELLLVTLTIIGGQAMSLLTLKSQTNSLLNQLRSMNEGGGNYEAEYTEPPVNNEPPIPTVEKEKESPIEDLEIPLKDDNVKVNYQNLNEIAELSEEEVLISDSEIQTKE
tara:strand:+ start:5058 stop:6296 length:1239 start_codon:yes stop_codon:yes gene_type:complete